MADFQHIYDRITAKIIAQLEKGVVPWLQPWSNKKASRRLGRPPKIDIWPQNAVTGAYYSGANVFMTWMHMAELGLNVGQEPALFLTFKQAKARGGSVKKGEKATFVVSYDRVPLKPKDGQTEKDVEGKSRSMAFGHAVFHISQCEGVELPRRRGDKPVGLENDAAWQVFLKATKAKVVHGGVRAYYHVAADFIAMPTAKSFDTPNSYKSVACHELVHWTGHTARLGRDLSSMHGTTGYAFEELVAEIGAAFLCAQLGLSLTKLKHVEYLAMWLKALKNDRKFIMQAASKAGAAATFIMDLTKEAMKAHAKNARKAPRKAAAREAATPVSARQPSKRRGRRTSVDSRKRLSRG
jgi:antirestriction protein ArdC